MVEQPESVDTSEQQRESKEISEVTVWMLLSEIRTATHGVSEPVLRPDGYEIRFGKDDSDVTVYARESDDEPGEALYHLYVNDRPKGWQLEVSADAAPLRRVPLDEPSGRQLRELIAEGNRKRDSQAGIAS